MDEPQLVQEGTVKAFQQTLAVLLGHRETKERCLFFWDSERNACCRCNWRTWCQRWRDHVQMGSKSSIAANQTTTTAGRSSLLLYVPLHNASGSDERRNSCMFVCSSIKRYFWHTLLQRGAGFGKEHSSVAGFGNEQPRSCQKVLNSWIKV